MLSTYSMRISGNIQQTNPSHKGLLNNKTVLKGLEVISEHGTTFVSATTLAMATGVRPIAINLTPNVKKENKQYATTNSIASGLIKFGMVEAIALPVENAIKKIDRNPEKYLNEKTIKALQGSAKTLAESKNYKFATQIMKMGTGLVTAIPKAMLTVALIQPIMNKLFPKKQQEKNNITTQIYNQYNPVFSSTFNTQVPSFKGGITHNIAKGIGGILNNETVQSVVKKYAHNDKNIARNVSMATDILLTGAFVYNTQKNKQIEEKRKKPLIYNNLISTGVSLVGGYSIDKLVQKNTKKFIDKFTEANKNDPKLPKYIEGINILRPTLIFAAIYYGILPMFSTYLADKIDEKTQTKN